MDSRSTSQSCAFGGCKQSGNGRDRSLHAFDKYTELKTTWIQVGGGIGLSLLLDMRLA